MSVVVATTSTTPTKHPENQIEIGPLSAQQQQQQQQESTTSESLRNDDDDMSPKDDPQQHQHAAIDYTHLESVEKILTTSSVDHNFKMKDADLQALRKLPGNSVCIDCGEADPIWASVNLGIFVCLSCSGQHRALGTHVSFVRSVQMDSWSDVQLKKMYTGGNDQCTEFLKKHGVEAGDDSSSSLALVDKYDTPAAHLYQKVLSARIKGEPEPTELPKLAKKKPVQRTSLKLEGFGSSPQPENNNKGLFQRFRTMSMNEDGSAPNVVRNSTSSAPSSGNYNIGELPIKPSSFSEEARKEENNILTKLGFGSMGSVGSMTDVELSEREISERDTSDRFPIQEEGEGENKEEDGEEDDFNIDDLVNQIVEDNDTGYTNSRWSKAAKESSKDFKPPGGEEDPNGDGILRRISRSSWFGGGQVGANKQEMDKLEEEIKKSEHDDIRSILEDESTEMTVATSQSPSAHELPIVGEVDEDGDIMPAPPGRGFFRKVSRTISGKGQVVRRDTSEADAALDKFMDDL